MELLIEFFTALYDLSNAMAFYILFGLAFAGIMHELVPETLVTKHLGRENIASVIKSTILASLFLFVHVELSRWLQVLKRVELQKVRLSHF